MPFASVTSDGLACRRSWPTTARYKSKEGYLRRLNVGERTLTVIKFNSTAIKFPRHQDCESMKPSLQISAG